MYQLLCSCRFDFFFFNDTAATEIFTLSLHDALPISVGAPGIEPDVEVVPHRDVTSRHHREGEGRILVFPEPRLRRVVRSEEHTSELQSQSNLVCRLLLEKKKITRKPECLKHILLHLP